jgi:hypothetical protein
VTIWGLGSLAEHQKKLEQAGFAGTEMFRHLQRPLKSKTALLWKDPYPHPSGEGVRQLLERGKEVLQTDLTA